MSHVRLNLGGHRNTLLEEAGFVWPGCLQVDLADPQLPERLSRFLAAYISSGDRVTLVLPGLSPLASLIITVVLGLSGQLPRIQTLVRDEQGEFVLGPVHDLADLRSRVARRYRQDIIPL